MARTKRIYGEETITSRKDRRYQVSVPGADSIEAAPAAHLLTVPQACYFLQIGRSTLYRHMADKKNPLPYRKIGGCTRFELVQIQKWVAKK
jgi:predicted DNA-binding transcriptional regulator AlpA